MKKTTKILIIAVILAFFSCSKDQQNLKESSMVDESGQISNELINDPLFKEFDKANYIMSQDLIKYAGEKIDKAKRDQINKDARNLKFKNFVEYFNELEKAGYKDYHQRIENQKNALDARNNLFNKYPELKSIASKTFFAFYKEHKKYEISETDINSYLEKFKQNKENIE